MDTEDEFAMIRTGNGYQNDLIATTNDRIKKQVQATRELHNAISELNTSIQKFNTESSTQTKELITLTKSIKNSNKEASIQTQKLITLTKWIVILTVVLVAGLIVQLITAK